jgi:alcohol dehydrogenase class IV
VIFGTGTKALLNEEVANMGLRRVLVLSGAKQKEEGESLAQLLGNRAVDVHAFATMHTPVSVTEVAMERVQSLAIDGLVAIGGGSSIGLSKAIALRSGLPQIVLPTTYAGSEMTAIIGETASGVKTTRSDPRVLPVLVIYDVELSLTLPSRVSAVSGLNAMAHAVEALYAKDRNPIVSLMGLEAVKAMQHALPAIMTNPGDLDGRSEALYSAWLCGFCLGAVGMALHHKLCHTLGGAFGLPHAETHAVILPHALAYNATAIPDVIRSLQKVLGSDPPLALYEFARNLGAPSSLRDIGMNEVDIDRACELSLKNSYWNPRPLDLEGIRALISRAWAGEPPRWDGHMV